MALTLRNPAQIDIWNILWFQDLTTGEFKRVGVEAGRDFGLLFPNFDEVRTKNAYRLSVGGVDLMPSRNVKITKGLGGTPKYDTVDGFLEPGDYYVDSLGALVIQRRIPSPMMSLPMYLLHALEWTGDAARPGTLQASTVSQFGRLDIVNGVLTSAVD